MKFWVYMLRCVDESYYIGVTNNLKMRLHEHITGFDEGCYTYKRLPVECVYSRFFEYVEDAIRWEKRIKRWTRAKKEALFRNDKYGLQFGSRGQCRRRIDHMRSIIIVSLRRTQADTDETHTKSRPVSW